MSKKISIIEPFKHYEVLASVLRSYANQPIEIHCFTNTFCKNHIETSNNSIHWHVESSERLSSNFLLEHLEILNDCEAIFFTTIDFHSTIWRENILRPSLEGLIHNSNNFFFFDQKKPKSIVRHFYNKWRGDFQKAKKILDRLDRVVLPSKSIEAHIRKEWNGDLKKLKTIDIAVPEFQANQFKREKVIITIPGTINQDRRDYKILLDLLPKVDTKVNRPVQLQLLGRPFSKKEQSILDQLKAQKMNHIELITFDGYVSIEEYKKKMQDTDFLLLPIQQFITYKSLAEERGKTCISGNINDMIQYALPAILPDFYPLQENWTSLTATFKSKNDLEEILIDWINQDRFNERKQTRFQV